MSLFTDYFVADQKQLADIFKGWLTVADEPDVKEAKNPFTGQIQRTKSWPAQGPILAGEPSPSIDLKSVPHVEMKNVDLVKIAALISKLTGETASEAIDQVIKPALEHPTNKDVGLHEIPASLVSPLRELSDDELKNLADQWHQTEEMGYSNFSATDCIEVLQMLQSLAVKSSFEQRMYHLWSL